MAPTTAAAAANEFLRLSWEEPNVPAVTQMKLQKLLFYAHGWHLALKDSPLFDEDFEAWEWGPVVRDVYFDTRAYGKERVSGYVSALVLDESGDPLKARIDVPMVTNEPTRDFIRAVWDIHKKYTAVQLSNSTHAKGEPWTIIRDKYGSLERKPTIPNELISEVFKKKMKSAGTGTDRNNTAA